MAITTPNYVAQPFNQDSWIGRDSRLSGSEGAEAFLAISRMNVAFFEALSQAERDTVFAHPEYGSISVDWVLHQMAGHQIHHLNQLTTIAAKRA
jgi:hypothetical protein